MKRFVTTKEGSKHMIEDPIVCSTKKLEKKLDKLFPGLYLVYSEPDEVFQIWSYDKNIAESRKKNSGYYFGDTIGVSLDYEQVTNEAYVLRLLNRLKVLNEREDLLKKLDDEELQYHKDYMQSTEEYRDMIIDEYNSVISGAIYIPKRDSKGKLYKVLRRY